MASTVVAQPPAETRRASRHALVMGGTGMLRGVSIGLARRYDRVSVIARTSHGLEALRSEVPGGVIYPLRLDWHDGYFLARRVNDAIEANGRLDLVVCWCQVTAVDAPIHIARRAADVASPVPFIHVLMSSNIDRHPVKSHWRDTISDIEGIDYRIVQIGCERVGGYFRWLSEPEICDAVLASIDASEPYTFIGQTIP